VQRTNILNASSTKM